MQWNSGQSSPHHTLSSSNLVVTKDQFSNGVYTTTLGTPMLASGRYYWEIQLNQMTGDADLVVGFGNVHAPVVDGAYIGSDVNGWGWFHDIPYNGTGGEVTGGVATQLDLSGFHQGDIISIAIDLTSHKWWGRVNSGNWNAQALASQNPSTSGQVGGFAIPAALYNGLQTVLAGSGGSITDQFGDVWTISGGATVQRNGSDIGFTANVAKISYVANVMWHENLSNQWYSWDGSGNWIGGSDPTVGAVGIAPAITLFADGDFVTGRFAASSWSFTAPTGFGSLNGTSTIGSPGSATAVGLATAQGLTAGGQVGTGSASGRGAATASTGSLGASGTGRAFGQGLSFGVAPPQFIGTTGAIRTIDVTNCVSLTPVALPSGIDPPPYRLRLAYQHNYTVQQTSDLNPTAPTAIQQFVASPDTYASWSSGPILARYRRPNDPAPFGGGLLVPADAQTAVTDIGNLFGGRSRLYEAVLPVAIGIQFDLGDVVRLTYPMDDLRTSRIGQVVGERLRSGDPTITLRILVTVDARFAYPGPLSTVTVV